MRRGWGVGTCGPTLGYTWLYVVIRWSEQRPVGDRGHRGSPWGSLRHRVRAPVAHRACGSVGAPLARDTFPLTVLGGCSFLFAFAKPRPQGRLAPALDLFVRTLGLDHSTVKGFNRALLYENFMHLHISSWRPTPGCVPFFLDDELMPVPRLCTADARRARGSLPFACVVAFCELVWNSCT